MPRDITATRRTPVRSALTCSTLSHRRTHSSRAHSCHCSFCCVFFFFFLRRRFACIPLHTTERFKFHCGTFCTHLVVDLIPLCKGNLLYLFNIPPFRSLTPAPLICLSEFIAIQLSAPQTRDEILVSSAFKIRGYLIL